MKFSAIITIVASTQAVYLSATQKTEIKAAAESMNEQLATLTSSMEESQQSLAELQERFDLFNPSSW